MEYDLTGVKVMLSMPIHYDIPWQTMLSLLDTQALCFGSQITLDIRPTVGGDTIVTARSKCVDAFLKSDCTHLFFIDADISWKATDFGRFVVLGTKMECVCAAYRIKQDPPSFFLNVSKEVEHGAPMTSNQWGCLPIKGIGLGFTIVQRKVLEQLAAKAEKLRFPDQPEPIACIFRCDSINGEWRGEDMNFFSQVEELGYSVNMEPSTDLGHIGSKEFKGNILEYLSHKPPLSLADKAA